MVQNLSKWVSIFLSCQKSLNYLLNWEISFSLSLKKERIDFCQKGKRISIWENLLIFAFFSFHNLIDTFLYLFQNAIK